LFVTFCSYFHQKGYGVPNVCIGTLAAVTDSG